MELGEPPGRLPSSLGQEQTFQNVHYSLGKKGEPPGEHPRGDCERPGSDLRGTCERPASDLNLAWAEGVWIGKWCTEQREAWMRQILEVQMWRQVRGLAGAVMYETRDLGTQWPQWQTLIFEGQV